jgi:hypothetical protein
MLLCLRGVGQYLVVAAINVECDVILVFFHVAFSLFLNRFSVKFQPLFNGFQRN